MGSHTILWTTVQASPLPLFSYLHPPALLLVSPESSCFSSLPPAAVRPQAAITSHLSLLSQAPQGPRAFPPALLNLTLYTAARVIF